MAGNDLNITQKPASCCAKSSSCEKPTQWSKFLQEFTEIIMKVSVVALAVLAAIVSIKLFVPFFLAGIVYGVVQHWNQDPKEQGGFSSSFCTQGLLEQATGIRFHPLLNVLTNLALTASHVQHLTVYAPIVGIYSGGLVGKEITPFIKTCANFFFPITTPSADLMV